MAPGTYTLETIEDLRARADRQRVTYDAQESKTPAERRDWTYAAITAAAELAANAHTLGIR